MDNSNPSADPATSTTLEPEERFEPALPESRYDTVFSNRGSGTLDFTKRFELRLSPRDSTANLREGVEQYYVWVSFGDEEEAKIGLLTYPPDDERWHIRHGHYGQQGVGHAPNLDSALRQLLDYAIENKLASEDAPRLRSIKRDLQRMLDRLEQDEDGDEAAENEPMEASAGETTELSEEGSDE